MKRQFEALEHFAKVIYDDISLTQFERLCTFKLILDRDDGSNTPIEDFIVSLVDGYERRDDDGEGLTLEDIQFFLRQSITDDNNLSRAIENAHFMASRCPRSPPKKRPRTSEGETMPKTKTNEITQSELETCFAIHRAANTLAFHLGKRLQQGATVEPGHYRIEGHLPSAPLSGNLEGFHTLGISIETDLTQPEIFTGFRA